MQIVSNYSNTQGKEMYMNLEGSRSIEYPTMKGIFGEQLNYQNTLGCFEIAAS